MVKFCLLVCFLLFGVELVMSIAEEKVIYELEFYILIYCIECIIIVLD